MANNLGTATTIGQLNSEIVELSTEAANSGTYDISLGNNIALGSTQLEAINLAPGVTLDLIGNGNTLDGGGTQRGLFVYAGAVDISNLALNDFLAKGGSADLGGGGAGLGGGLFIASNRAGDAGAVTLDSVSFSHDSAQGGASGVNVAGGEGSGGGGMGGNSGNINADNGGGGIGGNGGGAVSSTGVITVNGQTGIIPGAAGGSGNIGGYAPPFSDNQGQTNGAGGASGGGGGGGGADNTQGAGGGGGVGAVNSAFGGNGGFGGGGGGTNIFVFGAGKGGFGGGGGSSHESGSGGFGGGSGAGYSRGNASPGGFGAGDGTYSGNLSGGGGLGAGGDIFVQAGASLTITGSSVVNAGSVAGGAAINPGQAFADGIYLQGSNPVLTFALTGLETVAGVIGDDTGSAEAANYAGMSDLNSIETIYTPGSVGITISGNGTLVLNAVNTFTGGTALNGGVLDIAAGASAGSGAITFGGGVKLKLDASVSGTTTFENTLSALQIGDQIDLAGLGFNATQPRLNGNSVAVTGTGGTETFTLSNFASGEILRATADGTGGTMLTVSNGPVIAVPSTANLAVGVPAAIAGVVVSENNSTNGETFTVVVSDATGVLTANTGAAGGGGTITSANGGTTLTIAGTLPQVNADLTTLKDTGRLAGSDLITASVQDGFGTTASGTIAVQVAASLGNLGTVTTIAELNTEIRAADAHTGAGVESITLGANIVLNDTALEGINLASGVTLDLIGNGHTLGGGTQQGLFVYAGTVAVDDLTIADTLAQGGKGANGGGGGGAGLGGGLFIASAGTVSLDNVTFAGDVAKGGAGSLSGSVQDNGGGGGGLGGDGGGYAGNLGAGGGGGIGSTATGGVSFGSSGGSGIIPGVGGGGAGASISASYVGGLGSASGGGGGGGAGGGGGGIGGGNGPGSSGGDGGFGGGNGGFGGGGGGGDAYGREGGIGGFGGGGGGGAGGGSGAETGYGGLGGNAGFGGGGGGGGLSLIAGKSGSGGSAGFGGGAGSASGGGGGLGAGGDIFVQQGGHLTITGGSSLSGGSVAFGIGATNATDGSDFGSGIFLQGNQTITVAPVAGQTLTISDGIADQTGSGGTGVNAGAGGIIMDGAGTLVLGAVNTFSGGITIQDGTLDLVQNGAAGTGPIDFETVTTLKLDATVSGAVTFKNTLSGLQLGDQIDLKGLGFNTTNPVLNGDSLVVSGTGGTETLTLGDLASNVFFRAANDGSGGTLLTINAPPTVAGPSNVDLAVNVATAITGVAVSEGGNTTGETFTVVISDVTGVLTANKSAAGGGGTITSANGGTTLTISGSLAQVNADLTTLKDAEPNLGSDQIAVSVQDGSGNTASETIAALVAVSVTNLGTVTTIAELNAAIRTADAATNPGVESIVLGADIALNGTALEGVNLAPGVTLDLIGNNHTLNGGGTQQGLFVYAGTASIENLTIADTVAQGGAGAAGGGGGGGGAGLGGGLFIASAGAANLDDVTFANDAAKGGVGGLTGSVKGGGGGGGGLGGAGGLGGPNGFAAGGGIGSTASGGSLYLSAGGNGIIPGAASGGVGGSALSPGGAGGASGGGGGAGFGGGGGGIGGGAGQGRNGDGSYSGGKGGFGGGGGGGSGYSYNGGSGGFGGGGGGGAGGGTNGGVGGVGGDAGFGGGGGGEGPSTTAGKSGAGGDAGFGGGSAVTGGAGGGLGAGGDIFVQQGGHLTIAGSSLLSGGSVAGGAGASSPAKGSDFGSGIFLQGSQTITVTPVAGQSLTISDVIADQSGSGGTGTDAGAGGIILDGAGKLVLNAANTFTGGITIQDGTLDLAQAGAAGAGPISFDPSADPTLEFTVATVPTDPIENFGIGDFLQIDGFALTGHSYNDGTLTLDGAGGPLTIKLPGADPASLTFSAVDGITTVGVLCFLAGSLIATPDDDVPVEQLTVGDKVLTASGAVRPIAWIGTGQVLAARGRRNAATPVIVRKGALADNVPYQDLRVTKGHALFIDEVLIPVEYLVNHRSILWDDRAQEATIYHIELETHDVLLANGAPAESYRDDGNRWLFQNANSGWDQPAKSPCAPVLTGGAVVDAVWRRLLDRSGSRPGLPLTEDPDVHLLLDGHRLGPALRRGSTYVFRLCGRPSVARIISRVGIPAELGTTRDPRPLGIPLQRIFLCQGVQLRVMEADDPTLDDGFHGFEANDALRWTNGDARLPAALFAGLDGPMELELHVGGTTSYPLFGDAFRSVAA